ncbi:MAG: hypothetical protein ACREFC_09445 [Stellaceae bacterium]
MVGVAHSEEGTEAQGLTGNFKHARNFIDDDAQVRGHSGQQQEVGVEVEVAVADAVDEGDDGAVAVGAFGGCSFSRNWVAVTARAPSSMRVMMVRSRSRRFSFSRNWVAAIGTRRWRCGDSGARRRPASPRDIRRHDIRRHDALS